MSPAVYRSVPVQTCIVGLGCVVLESIILVVEMFVYKMVPSNYLSVLFYMSLIAPLYYVYFRIRVCCVKYAMHRSILDSFFLHVSLMLIESGYQSSTSMSYVR
jgi:hypothetical protein